MELEPDDLIPEVQLWNEGRGIDLDGYLSCMGTYELAIAFANFFWPRFVEHDGCILKDVPDPETYESWKVATQGDRASIEASLNHVHLIDLFPNTETAPTRQQIVYLGKQLERMWLAKLKLDFPKRDFAVHFAEDCGGDLVGYQLTFYQKSKTQGCG